jgi:hypothetical protein
MVLLVRIMLGKIVAGRHQGPQGEGMVDGRICTTKVYQQPCESFRRIRRRQGSGFQQSAGQPSGVSKRDQDLFWRRFIDFDRNDDCLLRKRGVTGRVEEQKSQGTRGNRRFGRG